MKKLWMFCILLISVFTLFSCEPAPSSNRVLAHKQEQLMTEANATVGMPAILNFQEKKLMKLILEERDRADLICFAYLVPEMTGKLVFLGKCIGYGLPYSTQYTNPMKTERMSSYGIEQLPQADPNGLFMPSSSNGTWVYLINPRTNEPEVIFCEPNVLISPFPLTSDGV